MNELLELSLIDLTSRIKSRACSPVELMEAVLARIDETHGDLNAVVAMRDRETLLAEAREAEKRAASGQARPLEGVPLGVKDLDDVAGLVTSLGSLPYKDHVAERDSVLVERLKAAGAIAIGKTNAPEFGYTAITKNLVYGVTRSPWNLERTPGGSSGGSSAALTGCVLPLVTASDGGGSIRIPASFTGAFGLKPTFGRIPRAPLPLWYYGDTTVLGPLTKTVEDAALYLDQVVGPSPLDFSSLPHPGISYLNAVRAGLDQKLKIGFSPDLGYAVVQSDVAAAVEEGAKVFEKLGHRLETVPGGPPQAGLEWGLLGSFEIAAEIYPLLAEHEAEFGRTFLAGVKQTMTVTAEAWGRAARKRTAINDWSTGIFERYDLLITPTVPYDPPPAQGPFPEKVEGRLQPPAGVASFTIPFNLTGHPAATVRAGLSKTRLPMGLQIVGPRFREDLVLQAARVFEIERPWHPHWPGEWQ